jgi:hypothetical protein
MKEIRPPFSWKALLFDVNSKQLEEYDVLKYREKLVKDLKKKCATKEEFVDKLNRDLMWQFWSRCEYEMILYVENGRVFVKPWAGVGDPEKYAVDITDRTDLRWPAFAEKMLKESGWREGTVKIDVYDQLKFRFDELVDFCWNYQHKYQRTKK